MKKVSILKFTLFVSLAITFIACDPKEPETNGKGYTNGTFIVNEGNFQQNDGGIMFLNDTATITDLFKKVNNRPIGDIVQSFTIIGNKGYIVVNNSQKIEVVNMETFESIATIEGFSYPRQVIKVDDTKYLVTNGNGYENNYAYILDINSNQKIDSIAVGSGPDKVIADDSYIYIANFGGWSNDSTITVINKTDLTVNKTITVGDVPADLTFDADGNVWVLCKGLSVYDFNPPYDVTVVSNSKLVMINKSTLEAETKINFDHQVSTTGTNILSSNNNNIYFIDGGIQKSTTQNVTPTTLVEGNFYSIDVNSKTGNIWVSTLSKVIEYSGTGTKVSEVECGPYATSVIFN